MMMRRIRSNLVLLSLASVLTMGCSTTLQHGQLYGGSTTPKGPLGLSERAQNMRDRIGWGTFTVFAIPIAPVSVRGDGSVEVMNQLKDAIEQAGYQVKVVQSASDANGLPVLSCKVEEFSFRNYTWLFPLVFNWGTIKLEVVVNAPDGRVLWSRSYTGGGNGFYDFDSTVSKALTRILNDLVSDLVSTDFNPPKPSVPETTQAPMNTQPAAAAEDVPTQLKKLKELRDAGILTDEEYETRRKALVEKLSPPEAPVPVAPAVTTPSEAPPPAGDSGQTNPVSTPPKAGTPQQ